MIKGNMPNIVRIEHLAVLINGSLLGGRSCDLTAFVRPNTLARQHVAGSSGVEIVGIIPY